MVQRPEKAQQETSFPKASYVRTIAEVVVSSIFFFHFNTMVGKSK